MSAAEDIAGMTQEPEAAPGPVTLLDHEIHEGVLRLRLRHDGDGPPPARVTHRTEPIPTEITAEGEAGVWRLTATLPPAAISEGVQTLLVSMPDGTAIGATQLIVGRPADSSVEAQLDLMRQELDLLKRAIRRRAREAPE